MEVNVNVNERTLEIRGHADTKEKCAALTALCQAMKNTSGVCTETLESGHARFRWNEEVDDKVEGLVQTIQELDDVEDLELFAFSYNVNLYYIFGLSMGGFTSFNKIPTYQEITQFLASGELGNGTTITDVVGYTTISGSTTIMYDANSTEMLPENDVSTDTYVTLYVIRQYDRRTVYNIFSSTDTRLAFYGAWDGAPLQVADILDDLALNKYYGDGLGETTGVVSLKKGDMLSYVEGTASKNLYLIENDMRSYPHLVKDFADAYRAASGTNDGVKIGELSGLIGNFSDSIGEIYFSSASPSIEKGNDGDLWVMF